MEILITKSDWGMDAIPGTPARMEAVKAAGFDGFEAFFLTCDAAEFKDKASELELKHVAGLLAPNPEMFRKGLAQVLERDPILVNCHGGRDYHTHEESLEYFAEVLKIAREETDIPVVWETHRRCNLYSPWATERLLTDLPDLMINADFSHFCVVSEGDMTESTGEPPDSMILDTPTDPTVRPPYSGLIQMLPDPRKEAMMEIAIKRADHIHARVGDAHRPQCADPRIGEGLKWTKHFEGWWDRIIDHARARGRKWFTICPEYGSVPYAPADPVTNEALSDPFELAVWAKDRLRAAHG
ncbi:MAG: hypothetical protein CME55_08565 [Halieaceae bacterium]|nr:hypothetical protein [Halieaceae bacterium]